MMHIAASKIFAATGACLACSLLLFGEPSAVTSQVTAVDPQADTDFLNSFRMVLRVLSVLVVLAGAIRYIFFHTFLSQGAYEMNHSGEGKVSVQTVRLTKKKPVPDNCFDSEDDILSTDAGSTATSDDELEDAPSYSRTVMMNYRALCLASPTSTALSATMKGLQGLTVKDERSLKSPLSSRSVRGSNDDSRWASLRSSPGPRNQVKMLEMPPGLEQPTENYSNSWGRKANEGSAMLLSSPLVNPISSGLRPQRKL
eukprot:gnl/MRDRNA2_/MRDRNA2_88209_c0_seq1.p1 gnl/MRDRNA2_/MRDRNA2_88209_c0~~gnl/MRDRNA2_/MRDRNA2_88209_c0_seq1.p1  ORF type:complete len:256 (-),score=47.67 gnl/MRDRNA2_/MRDRNA2_88209_c0_seq1:196-963(-)